MQEECSVEDGLLAARGPITSGSHIRRQGEEAKLGDLLVPAGTLVTPPVIGLLATAGHATAQVVGGLSATVVGTGSELAVPGEALKPTQVYESNSFGISAALGALGVETRMLRRIPDRAAETKAALADALSASDVVVVCGGVSVGDKDFVRGALRELGVREVLWRVRIKPGKPFYFGISEDGQPVFGLPGNPVSALVVFTLFVRPAILKMQGRDPDAVWIHAASSQSIAAPRGRDEFARATLRNGSVTLEKAQGSHMLTGLATANALAWIREGVAVVEGDLIRVLPLRWWS